MSFDSQQLALSINGHLMQSVIFRNTPGSSLALFITNRCFHLKHFPAVRLVLLLWPFTACCRTSPLIPDRLVYLNVSNYTQPHFPSSNRAFYPVKWALPQVLWLIGCQWPECILLPVAVCPASGRCRKMSAQIHTPTSQPAIDFCCNWLPLGVGVGGGWGGLRLTSDQIRQPLFLCTIRQLFVQCLSLLGETLTSARSGQRVWPKCPTFVP